MYFELKAAAEFMLRAADLIRIQPSFGLGKRRRRKFELNRGKLSRVQPVF